MRFNHTIFVPFVALAAWAQPPMPGVATATTGQAHIIEIRSTDASFPGKLVKGMPYSAEAVNETAQTLPDGNRISRKSASNVYRDSQGRTRNELAMPNVGPWATKGDKIGRAHV